METFTVFEHTPDGVNEAEYAELIDQILAVNPRLSRVLLLVPDYTRFHSNAGLVARLLYHKLKGVQVDLLEALGTHVPMTGEQISSMYGDIPRERFIPHDWRHDVIKLGQVPGSFVGEVSDGIVTSPIDVEVNKRLFDGYDLIISIGQVVPHEVVGMANHTKNIFVGCGGASMINSSHMLGAFYGLERMMGRTDTPVRKVFDYAAKHYLNELPICYILTVTTAPGGHIHTHGIFAGSGRKCFEEASKLAQKTNLILVDAPLEKVIVYLEPSEFKSTWLGNKAVYRSRMAIADGGSLIVLAPGVERFGEDPDVDALIRKYGYCGRENVIRLVNENADLRTNMSAAAHLIHGSSDGRFSITYCTQKLTAEEVEGAYFNYMPYKEAAAKYDPAALQPWFNNIDGEKVYYIPNPALGLWANKAAFEQK
jgi:nickel-dependent lactate racemase